MGDGDKGGIGGMDGEVEIAANVGMGAGDDFEVVFSSELANVGVRSGGSDDDLARVSLMRDGFDAGFEVRAFLIGENDESMEAGLRLRHLGLLQLFTSVEFMLEKSGIDGDEDETGNEKRIDGAIDKGCWDKDEGNNSSNYGGDEVGVSLAAIFAEDGEEARENHSDGVENRSENDEKEGKVIGREVELEDDFEDWDADEVTDYECYCSEGEHGKEELFRGSDKLLVTLGDMVAGESADERIDEVGAN